MGNKVRQATADDAAGVAEVHVGTWQVAYRGMLPDEFLDGLDVGQRVLAYERLGVLTDPERPIFVLEENEVITGFVGVGPSGDQAGIGELYSIYVTSAYWGTTVGATLMAHAEEWLRSRFPAATLWVLDANARARRFYEKRGWTADGEAKIDDRGSFVLNEIRYRIDFSPRVTLRS